MFDAKSTASEVADYYSTNITGKVVLTTGVTQGSLGSEFVETIAKHKPKLLILAGRDVSKVKKTGEAIAASCPEVEVRYLTLDLGSQAQVRKAAEEVNGYKESIDVLVNNAGIMAVPYGKTVDGIENQFGICFVGHFLFTTLILEKILASGQGARIINVASNGHKLGRMHFDDWNFSVC
jgi:short-subunit dehydrogenase